VRRVWLIAAVLACGCEFRIPPYILDMAGGDQTSPPGCSDGVKNGEESDVDCGGSVCTRCGIGRICGAPADCATATCAAGHCAPAASCTDGVLDGTESDVDCGGSCVPCAAGKKCGGPADCITNSTCTAGMCVCNTGFLGTQCQAPVSCFDLQSRGQAQSGVALIDPDGSGPMAPFSVYCDMQKEGGGWTLLVRHKASAGFFGTDAAGRATNTADPSNDLYSILGMVDLFARNGSYELMYWNRDGNKFIHTTQTWSPLDPATKGLCPAGFALVNSDFTPGLLCGFTPGPDTWTVANGNATNWVYAVAQLKPWSSFPIVCTYPDAEQCNWIEFYVR
jgi:hypothetical protein